MSLLAPSWALGAHAIDVVSDSHLSPGVHVRVTPHPRFGLPLAPLLVYRINLGPNAKSFQGVRSDVLWRDSRGNELTAPFYVTEDNPVTGYLPVGSGIRCSWINVLGKQGQQPLHVSAWRATARGKHVVGTRSDVPYSIGASDIHGVVVSGTGTVSGLIWIDWAMFSFDDLSLWRIWTLPVKAAARYSGVGGADTLARQAVERGAPARLGLHDAPKMSGPSACPTVTVDDELARLNVLAGETMNMLHPLLEDVSQRPIELKQKRAVGLSADETRTIYADYPLLATLFMASGDPMIARWLGLLDRDESPPGGHGDVIVYLIRGFWGVDTTKMLPDDIAHAISLGELGQAIVTNETPEEPGLPFEMPRTSVDGFDVYDLFTAAIVQRGAPLDQPERPAVNFADDRPTRPGYVPPEARWNPDYLPPEARRELHLSLTNLAPMAGVAAAREVAGDVTGLNRMFAVNGPNANQRAHDLVPTLPADAGVPSEGRLYDREAPPEAMSIRVGQHDWFGRWSEWTMLAVTAADRRVPPAPVLRVDYTMASVPDPVPDGPLWGTLTARVRVPKPDVLPVSSYLLSELHLNGTIDDVGLTIPPTSLPSDPDAWPDELVVDIPPPSGHLARHGSAVVRLHATWVDTAGQTSTASEVVETTCIDKRPPAPAVVDPTLRYTARPDATGRAWATVEWTAGSGQHAFRVYYCDETRLLNRLRGIASDLELPLETRTLAQETIDAWTAAGSDVEARAAALTFGNRPSVYERGAFQQLTKQPLLAGEGTVQFRHDLSGSLRVLGLYRILSVSEQRVESPFAAAPVVPFAVPNTGGPTKPLLERIHAGPDDPPLDAGVVRLKVRVLRGTQPVVAYRLRRSGVTSGDARKMPIAREDSISLVDDGESPLFFTIDDDGAYLHDPSFRLRSFVRYSWCVEVQAPAPAGSGIQGQWSRASEPVTAMLIPEAPTTPQSVGASIVDGNAVVEWEYSGATDGGTLGRYRFDIYGRTGMGPERRLASVLATRGQSDYSCSLPEPPAPTSYRVVALDPSGRMGPPSAPATTL